MPPAHTYIVQSRSKSISVQPSSFADEEDVEDYAPGGYLPVKVGDAFSSPNRRHPYTVIRKLGWGHFSTVWLIHNKDDDRYAALKVCSAKYGATARDEILLLEKVRKRAYKNVKTRHGHTEFAQHPGARHVVALIDYFSTRGRNRGDEHICMVLEPLGENLLSLLDRFRRRRRSESTLTGIPIEIVRIVAKQVLMGLQFLHDECNLVHTDIKPENILVCLPNVQDYIEAHIARSETWPSQRVSVPPKHVDGRKQHVDMYHSQPIPTPPLPSNLLNGGWNGSANTLSSTSSSRSRSRDGDFYGFNVQISDLGNATPADKHFTEDIQTRQYRAPEAIIRRSDWGTAVDIWSVACMIFELATGDHLFDPRSKRGSWEKDDDHMAQIIEVCGDFDIELKMGGKFSRDIFNSRGQLRNIDKIKPISLTQLLTETYNYPPREAKHFATFLEPMLRVDPSMRSTAAEMLLHEWLGPRETGDYSRLPQSYESYEWSG
ncbi:hypothetical protein M422DRAFT_166378 [Sphaerobolus stellatus SS14]|uniref:non-specific serine/threonine protein kinase n=1 Tax=Sphaerobolus stellatus (strain SS14) TaxID=990650 RepID=A0A0C9URY1_SPHS4|nr:hypothetical protein M422DRAFT_166378 [Sphaerobolus stellatus SS14]